MTQESIMHVTPYQMAINNTARFIRGEKNRSFGKEEPTVNAFDAARILSIAFCKIYDEVLADLINVKV